METHHPKIEKKGFREYLFEGLMIFIAVTLGFFAESLRERISDHAKEKKYLSSLVTELKYDTAQYVLVQREISHLRPLLDSMYKNVKEAAQFGYRLRPEWNTPVNNISIPYSPAMPTIRELKSSGNLRLLDDKQVAQKMMVYETFVEGMLEKNGNAVADALHKVFGFEDEYCDYTDFNRTTTANLLNPESQADLDKGALFEMPLIVKDPVKLNELANSFVNYEAETYSYYTHISQAKQIATELIKLITK